jgi:TonB family protein
VVAGFGIDPSGRPHDIEIADSSGYKVLDKEVIKIIRRASPYPYIPDRVEVPVSFRLVEGR